MESKKIENLNIKIFADGADIKQIKKYYTDPLIKGFTTNPTLMRNEGVNDYEVFAKNVLSFVKNKPISFEIFADDSSSIIKQAKYISSWGDNVYVKIPVTNTNGDFLGEVIKSLSGEGVKLNITAVFTFEQVKNILHELDHSKPNIISIFSGRIADSGIDPVKHFKYCKQELGNNSNIELLWASPREVYNLFDAEKAGADIITMSQDIINKFKNIGKDLNLYSKETVQMFFNDAKSAGYNLGND